MAKPSKAKKAPPSVPAQKPPWFFYIWARLPRARQRKFEAEFLAGNATPPPDIVEKIERSTALYDTIRAVPYDRAAPAVYNSKDYKEREQLDTYIEGWMLKRYSA